MARGQLSPDKTTISLAIPKILKEDIGVIATKENRSMSNLICTLAEHYVFLNKSPEYLKSYYELISKAKTE